VPNSTNVSLHYTQEYDDAPMINCLFRSASMNRAGEGRGGEGLLEDEEENLNTRNISPSGRIGKNWITRKERTTMVMLFNFCTRVL
jgi:hypothetical protein